MKKLFFVLAALAAVFALCGFSDGGDQRGYSSPPRKASEGGSEIDTDTLIDGLDLDDIQGIVDKLSPEQKKIFGFSDIAERVRALAGGDGGADAGSIFTYVLSLAGVDIFEFLPMLVGCIAIAIAYNLMTSIKAKFASESTERVVFFAMGALAVALVVGYFSSVLASAVGLITSIKQQINAVFPAILTLMTASGAGFSAGVYSPTVALLGGGMTAIVTYIAFPALLMGLVFDIIGCISSGIKLDKTADFFRSACKWFLGAAFFIFVTVIGVSGITASVRDGISVRAAKFAVSKYVPIIGGYLSQGFDFIMAGNVLIKNALGSSAVVLIILTAAPVITKLAVFTLTLKLTAAIAEPLGGERLCNVMTSLSGSSSLAAAIVIAMTFLYILFLSIVICTGNVAL